MGKLAQDLGGGLVVVQTDKRTSAEIAQQESTRPGPSLVVAGTGGKMLRWPDGHVTGPIGGEALRHALNRGAKVIGEEPVQSVNGPSITEQKNAAAADLSKQIEAVPTTYHR